MSKQWGHGFHKGREEGIESGFTTGVDLGKSCGQLTAGEHSWHTVNAAIDALEKGNDLQGLTLLRTLRFYLAAVTGRDVPEELTQIGD